MFAVGVDILHSILQCKFAEKSYLEAGNHRIQTGIQKQQLCRARGASHMSKQRRWLNDVCVLALPAEYAGASSGSGDRPQQYYLHRPKLTTVVTL